MSMETVRSCGTCDLRRVKGSGGLGWGLCMALSSPSRPQNGRQDFPSSDLGS